MQTNTAVQKQRIVHLVLYNPTPEYRPMYFHSRNWYRTFEPLGIETWYYYYDKVNEPTLDEAEMTLRLPGTESAVPGVLVKTLEAFRFFTTRGFRLLFRSNISSIINFHALLPCVLPLAPKLLFGGPHIMTTADTIDTKIDPDSATKLCPVLFPQGTCMVMSPYMVNMLLKYKSEMRMDVADDLNFAMVLKSHGILPKRIGNQYADFSVFQNINDVSSFRNRDFKSTDRKGNIANMRLEVNALFQRFVALAKPQVVRKVLYFNQDVTNAIRVLCNNTQWTTDQDNGEMDKLFGDPSPGLSKNLMVFFEDTSMQVLTNRCRLTFQVDNQKLLVQ